MQALSIVVLCHYTITHSFCPVTLIGLLGSYFRSLNIIRGGGVPEPLGTPRPTPLFNISDTLIICSFILILMIAARYRLNEVALSQLQRVEYSRINKSLLMRSIPITSYRYIQSSMIIRVAGSTVGQHFTRTWLKLWFNLYI